MQYMQKIYGCDGLYWTYCIGATDGLADAEAALNAEIEALEACLEYRPHADHALMHILSTNSNEYVDIKSEESPLQGEHYRSLNSLGRKLLVLCSRASGAPIRTLMLDTHAEALKKRLMKAHLSDALSEIVLNAWPEVATWEC